MRIELLPGETNVLRFPVEQRARPTLELLRDLAPDVREVLAVAEAYGLDMPVNDLRDRVDLSTAEHIANQVPAARPATGGDGWPKWSVLWSRPRFALAARRRMSL